MAPGALLVFFAIMLLVFIATGVIGIIKDRRDYNRAHRITSRKRRVYDRSNRN